MLKTIKLTNMKTSKMIFPRLVYKGRKDIVFTYFFFHFLKIDAVSYKLALAKSICQQLNNN